MSDKPLVEREIGEFTYRVYYDAEAYWGLIDCLYDTEEEREAHRIKHEREELHFYGIIKCEKCKCCDQLKDIDSLWGIEAEDPQHVLEVYWEGLA